MGDRYVVIRAWRELEAGTEIQRSVGGTFYPRDHRWGDQRYVIPVETVREETTVFRPSDLSEEVWELASLNIDADLSDGTEP